LGVVDGEYVVLEVDGYLVYDVEGYVDLIGGCGGWFEVLDGFGVWFVWFY